MYIPIFRVVMPWCKAVVFTYGSPAIGCGGLRRRQFHFQDEQKQGGQN